MLKCRACEKPADSATYVYGNEYVVFKYFHADRPDCSYRVWIVDAQKLIDEDKRQ